MENNPYLSPDAYETIIVYKIKNQRHFLKIIFNVLVRTSFHSNNFLDLPRRKSHKNKPNRFFSPFWIPIYLRNACTYVITGLKTMTININPNCIQNLEYHREQGPCSSERPAS